MGNELNCSRQLVASWEVGWKDEGLYPQHLPQTDHLVKLCSLYDCDPGYLLCEYDEQHKTHFDVSSVTGLTPTASSILVIYAPFQSFHSVTNIFKNRSSCTYNIMLHHLRVECFPSDFWIILLVPRPAEVEPVHADTVITSV